MAQSKQKTVFKVRYSKGDVAVSAIGIGLGIWGIVAGTVAIGAVLLALCAVVIGMQINAYRKMKV